MPSRRMVYLDYAATTPLDPRVLEAMHPYFSEVFGNPSSMHAYGQQAEAAVEQARHTVAELIGCTPDEIVFTGSGSESDNLALRGAALAARRERGANHILISPVEHPAIARTADQLAEVFGFEVERLPVDACGRVDPEEVARRLRPDTAVVSVIYGNNEIGTLNPIAEIGAVCRERGVPFHTDAVQAAAHLPLDLRTLPVDLLSLTGHKFYGPKGVGVLFVRRGTSLLPHLTGGSQEEGRRAGTHNVPGIVGLAEALRLNAAEREARNARLRSLRDHLIEGVLTSIPEARLTGHPTERLPNHASFVFRGVSAQTLLMLLDVAGFACSSGSACKVGQPEPSEVLLALGLPPEWALGALRVTLGKDTTAEEVEAFLAALPEAVAQARRLNS